MPLSMVTLFLILVTKSHEPLSRDSERQQKAPLGYSAAVAACAAAGQWQAIL